MRGKGRPRQTRISGIRGARQRHLCNNIIRNVHSLVVTDDATGNPHVVSLALLAYGYARRDADPVARITFIAEA